MKQKKITLIPLLLSSLLMAGCEFNLAPKDEHTTHTYGQWVVTKNPTCTETGTKTRTCTECDKKETETVPALGHNLSQWNITEPATCTEDGSQERHCLRCTYSETEAVTKTGHTFGDWTTTVEPTETEEGTKTRECSKCHYVETSSIPKTGVKYDYDGYYDSLVSWTDSADLVSKLHTIISGGTYSPISYADPTNWETNAYADQALDDFESVDIMYSDKNNLKTFTAGASTLGWNREHCFCASLMTGSNTGDAVKFLGRATDFQNLIAAGQAGNQSRGNKNYGYADKSSSYYTNKTVNNGADGYSYDNKNFEPANYDKGRAARAILYMSVMYNETVRDTENSKDMGPLTVQEEYVDYTAGSYTAFAHGNLSSLLEWANLYPVDRLEYQHNESVYSHVYVEKGASKGHAQGNRNPFVDYPELVEYVFGAKKNIGGSLSQLTPSYNSLGLDDSKNVANYAIQTAKRTYEVGDTFTSDDYQIVKVYKDFHTEVVSGGISSSNYTFTASDAGKKIELTINTPLNTIKYDVEVSEKDETKSCNYSANLNDEKAAFNNCKDKAADRANHSGIDNEVTLKTVPWLVKWTNSYINGFTADKGMQLGSSTYQPKPVSFTSKNSFAYNSKTNISKIYVKANTASGTAAQTGVPLTVKIGDTTVLTTTVTYIATGCNTYGIELSTPLSGVVSITFGTSTKACALYVHTIAIQVD